MNIEEAKNLKLGQTIYHARWKGVDQRPERWRVNGRVQLWKRDQGRIRVPLKRGFYDFCYLTERNLVDFLLEEPKKEVNTHGS